jgi:hypothetical protein
MDITVTEEELTVVTEALQALEENLAKHSDAEDDKLKFVRKLFQRLHTLNTAQ